MRRLITTVGASGGTDWLMTTEQVELMTSMVQISAWAWEQCGWTKCGGCHGYGRKVVVEIRLNCSIWKWHGVRQNVKACRVWQNWRLNWEHHACHPCSHSRIGFLFCQNHDASGSSNEIWTSSLALLTNLTVLHHGIQALFSLIHLWKFSLFTAGNCYSRQRVVGDFERFPAGSCLVLSCWWKGVEGGEAQGLGKSVGPIIRFITVSRSPLWFQQLLNVLMPKKTERTLLQTKDSIQYSNRIDLKKKSQKKNSRVGNQH